MRPGDDKTVMLSAVLPGSTEFGQTPEPIVDDLHNMMQLDTAEAELWRDMMPTPSPSAIQPVTEAGGLDDAKRSLNGELIPSSSFLLTDENGRPISRRGLANQDFDMDPSSKVKRATQNHLAMVYEAGSVLSHRPERKRISGLGTIASTTQGTIPYQRTMETPQPFSTPKATPPRASLATEEFDVRFKDYDPRPKPEYVDGRLMTVEKRMQRLESELGKIERILKGNSALVEDSNAQNCDQEDMRMAVVTEDDLVRKG